MGTGLDAREAGEAILRVAGLLTDVLGAATADEHLTLGEARLLRALADDQTQGRLAERLGSTPSQVARLTTALEDRGLLRRTTSRHDRRVRQSRLTAEGRATLDRVGRRLRETSPLVRALGPDELRTLVDLLGRVEAVGDGVVGPEAVDGVTVRSGGPPPG